MTVDLARTASSPPGRTDGTTSRIHAIASSGERTVCGRRIGRYWETDRPAWETWRRNNPRMLCARCLSMIEET